VNGQRSLTRLGLGTLAVAAAVAFLVSGCSDVGFFPPVHDLPAPRADTPLTPDQVKQATDALASERDHLNTGAQANGQPSTTANGAPPSPTQPAGQSGGATQTAGAGTKP
jgi:hypothetical protein